MPIVDGFVLFWLMACACGLGVCCGFLFFGSQLFGFLLVFDGEFDPGSGRTLAACLTHASRAERPFRGYSSGERVSNT